MWRKTRDMGCFSHTYGIVRLMSDSFRRDPDLDGDALTRLMIDRHSVDNGRAGLKIGLEALLRKYGNAEATDTKDRVYALLAMVRDCQHSQKFIADYEISVPMLFFAIMHFCQPLNPVRFAMNLQEILKLRVDEIAYIIHSPDAPRQSRNRPLPLTASALTYLSIFRQEVDYFASPRTGNWREASILCEYGIGAIKDPLDSDTLFQIRLSDIALIARLALRGHYLHGLAMRRSETHGSSW